MRYLLASLGAIATLALPASAQTIPAYYSSLDFLATSPSTDESAIGAYFNPAVAGADGRFDSRYLWSPGPDGESASRWGIFSTAGPLSYGVAGVEGGPKDHRLSISVNDGAFGLGYGWSSGQGAGRSRESVFTLGTVQRPNDYVSLGIAGLIGRESDEQVGIFDIGIRPLGDPRLLLFADAELRTDADDELSYGAGAAIEPIPGLRISGKYTEAGDYGLGLSLSLGATGLFGQLVTIDNPGGDNTSVPTYGVRWGDRLDNPFDLFTKKKSDYLVLELDESIAYRRFRLFDDSPTLVETLADLDRAIGDPRIGGVAVNLAGVDLSREMAWELRRKLEEVRAAEKRVVVFVETGGMVEYHLASAADHVVIDPVGALILPGQALGRTYLKGTLEKLGLGFDELRFFKYKSAAETLSRDSFSEADREQWTALNDGFYEQIRADVSASRKIDGATFDAWVDDRLLFLPEEAQELGLVDAVARWNDLDETIEELEGEKRETLDTEALLARESEDRDWGERPIVAVVYGLGVCAMDTGIKARELEETLLEIAENDEIEAVVFRADSPGGDALASDLVAEALRECSEKKPVIVSMGSVAGSGGYWMSMYGDRIFAAPNTITGSIGVIAGWIWNDGLGEHLGMTSDHVQRGEHSDLSTGLALPLLGVRIPERALRPDERIRIEETMKALYEDFVHKVADGREMEPESVEAVAQGRVWLGSTAKEKGLVDEIGGFDDAIDAAKLAAGIASDEEIELLELPRSGLFDPAIIQPWPTRLALRETAEWGYIEMVTDEPRKPLVMMPPSIVP